MPAVSVIGGLMLDRAAAAGTTVDHRAEQSRAIQRLRRENAPLRQDRDILKKAVAIFTHPSPNAPDG